MYDGKKADQLLFDASVVVLLWAFAYAVLHRFDAATLAVIAGFGGGSLVANLKQP